MIQVSGVDGCRGGWVVVSFYMHKEIIVKWHWKLCPGFQDVVTFTASSEYVAVDMPIGLPTSPDSGGRLCDRAARHLLGPRRFTIFTPPIRE
jgi:predicted RNase H-like nuclease